MASTISKALSSLLLASALFFSGVLGGEITCEKLDRSKCAFSVASSGLRCVLEKRARSGGEEEYSCRNSGVAAGGVAGWIETNECVEACGLDRDTVGISSDYIFNSRFTRRLCSSGCYHNCPNVVDLYNNVATGEGVSLSELCELTTSTRREMNEINSSGEGNVGAARSPVGLPVVGRKLIGWFASAPEAGRKLIDLDGEEVEEASAPL